MKRRLHIRLEFKPQDLWVGAYWKTTFGDGDFGQFPVATDIWICLLPCLPIHLTWWHRSAGVAMAKLMEEIKR